MPLALAEPVKLPCGLVLPNRFVKAAMAESMASTKDNLPNQVFVQAYTKWAEGGWGALLTGNVQVDPDYLGGPNDPVAGEYNGNDTKTLDAWRKYADACQKHGTPAIVQICHPGRQSPRGAGRRGLCAPTLAPSAIPLNFGDSYLERFFTWLAFGSPREMTVADIERVVRRFVDTARLMADSGFAGVELHAAHGYLLTQFLSSKTNRRTDDYGGTPEKRAKIVLDIIKQIREAVPSNFCVGIKLNSADHDSAEFEDTMRQIELLVESGIDFLEVSGGSYEDPKMTTGPGSLPQVEKSQRTLAREAFFLDFAAEIRKRFPNLVLMVTGGFRSRKGAEAAVQSKACDLVGIARPAAINPKFPQLLLDESVPDEKAQLVLGKVPLPTWAKFVPLPKRALGAGAESLYYVGQIQRMAKGLPTFGPRV
ncbi:hypothetical protein VTN77DRAFT_2837 [Rasamsonia byssochlamydoides]|uniref:uncharacterized protein n=1 Tax=Rasamsonia byssochlamydoides TaxID=89139 RepID=UPI003742650A